MDSKHYAGAFAVLTSIYCFTWPVPCMTESHTRPETYKYIEKNIIDTIEMEIEEKVTKAFEKSLEEMHDRYHYRLATLEKEVLRLSKTNDRLEKDVSRLRKKVRLRWTKDHKIDKSLKSPSLTDNLKNGIKVTEHEANVSISTENFDKSRRSPNEDDAGIIGEKIQEHNHIQQHQKSRETRVHKGGVPVHTFSASTRNVSQRNYQNSHRREKAHSEISRASGNPEKVAFTAFNNADIHGIGTGITLKFDGVTTNIGSGYNHVTGVFVCPVAGTYVFYHNLEVSSDLFFTKLMKNGVMIGHNIVASDHSNDVGSAMTIINLKEGDNVWIQTDVHNSGTIVYTFGSTFSGFLLYPS